MNEDLDSDGGVFRLRKATNADLEFLFRVSTLAMKPVSEALNPDKKFDEEVEFEKYKAKFDADKIDVIQYMGEDVGRLRIVRSPENIYVGGIQILPEFQGKGIGTAIFEELIKESNTLSIPITLEVHDINERAINFYKKLGFALVKNIENKIVMEYRGSA